MQALAILNFLTCFTFHFKLAHARETYIEQHFIVYRCCGWLLCEINLPQIHWLTMGLYFTPPDDGCYLCQFASLRVLPSCSVRTTSSNEPTQQSGTLRCCKSLLPLPPLLLLRRPDINPCQGSNQTPTDQLTITGIWTQPYLLRIVSTTVQEHVLITCIDDAWDNNTR